MKNRGGMKWKNRNVTCSVSEKDFCLCVPAAQNHAPNFILNLKHDNNRGKSKCNITGGGGVLPE